MSTILFVWTIVATSGNYMAVKHYAWRPMGEFATPADCQRAMVELNIEPSLGRCVQTGKK